MEFNARLLYPIKTISTQPIQSNSKNASQRESTRNVVVNIDTSAKPKQQKVETPPRRLKKEDKVQVAHTDDEMRQKTKKLIRLLIRVQMKLVFT